MAALSNRIKRLIGYAIIGGIWSVLLGIVSFFVLAYAIYADLKASNRSHLTRGTYAEHVAAHLYRSLFAAWWPGENGGEFDPELVYVPKPGVTRFRGPESDVRVSITSERMRAQPEPDVAKIRPGLVVLAGDSFTFGLGVNDEETFSALLQTRYQHRTINTGVPSYGTARELMRLRREGLIAKASVVVIQYCGNDAGENSFFLREGERLVMPEIKAMWEQMASYRPIELTYGRVLGGVATYLRQRMAIGGIRGLWREIRDRRSARRLRGNPSDGAGIADDFLAVLDRFPELAGKPVLVTELGEHGAGTSFLAALKTRCADRPNIRIVPLQFEAEDHFRFKVHLNARGHEKAAEQLDRALRALDATPAASSR